MPTVNESINWWQPGTNAFVSPMEGYLQGRKVALAEREQALQEKVFQANQQKAKADLAKEQQEAQKRQLDIGKEMRAREFFTTGAMEQSAQTLQKAAATGNPQIYAAAYRQAQQQAAQGVQSGQFDPTVAQLPADPVDPAALPQVIAALRERKAVVADEGKWNAEQTGAANLLAEQKGGDTAFQDPRYAMHADPEGFAKAKAQYIAEQKALKKSGAASNTVNLGPGAVGPTKTQQTRLQQKIDEALPTLDDIKTIRGLGDPSQFLGYMPRGRFAVDKVLAQAGSLPEGERDFYLRGAQARSIINKFRSEEFHRLIGSNQTATEVKTLADSIISPDMDPVQFPIVLQHLEDVTTKIMQHSQDVLAHGYQVGTAGYNREMAKALGDPGEGEQTAIPGLTTLSDDELNQLLGDG